MKPYRVLMRRCYNFFKKLKKQNSEKLYKKDKNSINREDRMRSEIFGDCNRCHLVRQINKQLAIAGQLMSPKKKLTSHSYRLGVAQIINANHGIRKTADALGQVIISATVHSHNGNIRRIH